MQLIVALACRYLKLTQAQALAAATINAAYAIGRGGSIGSLEIGKQADVLIMDVSDYRAIGYRYGTNLVRTVIKRGQSRLSRILKETELMKVSDIMTTEVMTVKRETSVNEVAKLMGAHDISGVPVVDDENHVVGIITELDLIVRNTRLEMPHFIEVLDWGRIPLERPGHAKERLQHMLGTAGAPTS